MKDPAAPGAPRRRLARRPTRLPSLALTLLVALLALATADIAPAQHAGGDGGSAPPPPAGPGRIDVRVVNVDDTKDVDGLDIALYALGADGRPGFTDGKTDAEGRVRFTNLSNDPAIVYLVGARYRDIPFGERVTFEAGETETTVTVEVSRPIERTEGVRVGELRLRFDWMGDRVLVREIVRFDNPSGRVVQLPKAAGEKAAAIVRRRLPPEARDFELATTSIADGVVFEDGVLRYFGPLYAGEQRIEYQYTLPTPAEKAALRVPIELDRTAGRVVAVAGTPGMTIGGSGLVASSEVSSDAGKPLSAWARGRLSGGERAFLELSLPETRRDPDVVALPRADVWLELDDTRLTATVDLQVEVAPGAPVAGTPEAPLLSITLPAGASLTGVAPETEAMGLVPRDGTGFDVIGPIAAGTTSLGYAYRLDAKPEGLTLDLRFARAVSTLNVLVADTDVALDSHRLHRLRPFRSGTRTYLHREAFNVTPDEIVDLRLEPLRARGLPREAGIGIAFAAIAGAAAFLVGPLMKGGARVEERGEDERARLRAEREAAYAAIGDLEHDFETGKLDAADYATLRESLRARAIELLRNERDGTASVEATIATAGPVPAAASAGTPPTPLTATATDPATTTSQPGAARAAGYCPSCGAAREASWRFCAGCGAGLPGARGPAA